MPKRRRETSPQMGKSKPTPSRTRTIASIEQEIHRECESLAEIRKTECFPLLIRDVDIRGSLVDEVYDQLMSGKQEPGNLDVIVDSGGGDIDAAYNLALLFRRYGRNRLTFIVPRWAKSAATLLICAGDEILMTPVAELGPLDPQITAMNPHAQRMERFSPLHIESTLQLIRDEFKNGNAKLAEGLMQRLQFPLTLGSFKKSLDVGREYVVKLLSSRMLRDNTKNAENIGKILTTGYADHSWCIKVEEAQNLGLKAQEIKEDALEIVWKIHKLNKEMLEIIRQEEQTRMEERMKGFPVQLATELPAFSPSIEPKQVDDSMLKPEND